MNLKPEVKKPEQMELLPKVRVLITPENFIEEKLPKSDLVKVSDVCAAFGGIDEEVVYRWRESGEIDGINLGSPDKAFWKIFRRSVVDFYHRRLSAGKKGGSES